MSDAKHTEGRLEVSYDRVTKRPVGLYFDDDTETGCVRSDMGGWVEEYHEQADATMERLADCWNAMEGIADPEALRRERDEATALLRQSVDLISAGVLACVFGGEMTPQAEERINRLVDDLRAFLKKTEGDAS